MELIEFVTVDECPGKYSKEPREIHIYYKLIDKQPLPVRKCLEDSTCADNGYSRRQTSMHIRTTAQN